MKIYPDHVGFPNTYAYKPGSQGSKQSLAVLSTCCELLYPMSMSRVTLTLWISLLSSFKLLLHSRLLLFQQMNAPVYGTTPLPAAAPNLSMSLPSLTFSISYSSSGLFLAISRGEVILAMSVFLSSSISMRSTVQQGLAVMLHL